MKGKIKLKKKRKLKKKFVIFFSIYLVIIAFNIILLSLAKFTNFFEKNGSLDVAKWDVSVKSDDEILPTMTIGNDSTYQEYNLNVTSKSDVVINYSVVIRDVPTGVNVQVDDSSIYSENNHIITINNLGSFNANDFNNTHNHILKFILPLGIDIIDDATLNLDVVFTQVEL